MMTKNNSPQDIFNKIDKLIESSRYNESFLLLKAHLKLLPQLQKDLQDLKSVEETYKLMLDFMASGNDDPSRSDLMLKVREALIKANYLLLRENVSVDSPDLYSSSKRIFALRNDSFISKLDDFNKALEEDVKKETETGVLYFSRPQAAALQEIFNYIWTLHNASSQEYDAIAQTLDSEKYPDYLKAIIISALTLACLKYFDASEFELLLGFFDSTDNISLRAKTFSGILLISLLHPQRVAGNIKLKSRLLLASEDEDFREIANDTLINIIRTYDTKRVDDKMRNEVIPGLMKLDPDIINKMKNMASDSENFLSDGNPDWEEILENSEIGNKIQEINDMQLEGADVMVTAFSNLKNFPFFNQISNWFVPFIPHNVEIEGSDMILEPEDTENFASMMCASDLHSFLLSLRSMPKENVDKMLSTFRMQMKELKEATGNSIGETKSQTLNRKVKHSLQDIYRFFKFFRKKNEFEDPFSLPFEVAQISPLLPLFGFKQENIRVIAEFYFKNKYYEEAAHMLELFDSLQPGNFEIWEKIGFSYDKLWRYDKAAEWYKKAQMINSENAWLNKKLAIALKNSGNNEEALGFYEKALESEPENYHLLMSLSQCLLELNRFDEARGHLYHARYLKPDKLAPERALAWTELLSGNYEKAFEIYKKIVVNPEAEKTDYLNAAHALLAQGNIRDALKFYRTFVDKSENGDIKNLVIAFRDDAKILKSLGVKTSDLRLIIDKIRYDLSM